MKTAVSQTTEHEVAVALATLGRDIDYLGRVLPTLHCREEIRDAVAHLDRLINTLVDITLAARIRAALKPADFQR